MPKVLNFRLHFATAFALVTLTNPAGAYTHADEIHTYATTAAISLMVLAHCPDLLVRTYGLDELRDTLHLTPADDMAVQLEIRIYHKAFESQIGNDAATWCADVLQRFGPDGTMMRGFVRAK